MSEDTRLYGWRFAPLHLRTHWFASHILTSFLLPRSQKESFVEYGIRKLVFDADLFRLYYVPPFVPCLALAQLRVRLEQHIRE